MKSSKTNELVDEFRNRKGINRKRLLQRNELELFIEYQMASFTISSATPFEIHKDEFTFNLQIVRFVGVLYYIKCHKNVINNPSTKTYRHKFAFTMHFHAHRKLTLNHEPRMLMYELS